MTSELARRIADLGLEMPNPAAPAANYLPSRHGAGQLFIAGQVPQWNGQARHIGRVGVELSVEEGQEAARLCALNILAQLDRALGGDLGRLQACLRVGGFVRCDPDFTDQPKVLNGASDLLVAVLGDRGRHARTAVGVAALPRGVAVEVDAIFAVTE